MTSEHVIGRYALYDKIASGGMATVYYGRLLGPVGFSRAVAIKQLHPQYSRDHDFVSMFVDEAHLTARIRHPNTVPVLDVVKHGRDLYIVMEYVLGVSLSELLRRTRMDRERVPAPIAASIIAGCLHGLHAAHETRDEQGALLGIVHRDVSPSNVLVGRDGMARVLDFGIAKAAGRAQITRHGEIKGKVGYMAPEQLRGGDVTRAADIYSAAVTLWETLTGLRAHVGDDPEEIMDQRLEGETLLPPSSIEPSLERFDDIVLRGVAPEAAARWSTAREMALALEAGVVASHAVVADWLEHTAGEIVARRGAILAGLETGAGVDEIRQAIRAALSLEDPSISVQTWTGSSLVLAELYEGASAERSDADVSDVRTDATTREVNALSSVDARDLTPTRVESSEPKPPAAAASAPIALAKQARSTPSETQDPTTREVLAPMDDDDEEWHDAVARASTARPIAPPPPASPSQRLMWTAAALLVVGGVIALATWGGPKNETAVQSDDAPASTPGTASAVADPPTASVDATADSPTAAETATEIAEAPPPPTAAPPRPPPPPPPTASHSAPPPVPAPPAPKDPFDQLGGRH